MSKVICVVTGTRAEYGILKKIISILSLDDYFQLNVFKCLLH